MSTVRHGDPIGTTSDGGAPDDVLVPAVPGASGRLVTHVDVTCRRTDGPGWQCEVTIVEGGNTTRHGVTVSDADLQRLDPGAADPHRLVDASFRFLLEREPPTSILPSFDLPLIGRYFPGYEGEIRRRLVR